MQQGCVVSDRRYQILPNAPESGAGLLEAKWWPEDRVPYLTPTPSRLSYELLNLSHPTYRSLMVDLVDSNGRTISHRVPTGTLLLPRYLSYHP